MKAKFSMITIFLIILDNIFEIQILTKVLGLVNSDAGTVVLNIALVGAGIGAVYRIKQRFSKED